MSNLKERLEKIQDTLNTLYSTKGSDEQFGLGDVIGSVVTEMISIQIAIDTLLNKLDGDTGIAESDYFNTIDPIINKE